MRIVAGIYGGRKLHVPVGREIRPTSDKIRGAVMNILRSRDAIEGAFVIDTFCGTGALGLEALSQGAKACIFMDISRESLELAKKNAGMLGVEGDFLLKDIRKIGKNPDTTKQAGLVFIDPPYGADLILPTLLALQQGGWIAQNAWIVVEAEVRFTALWPQTMAVELEKKYGETKIILLRCNDIKGIEE